MLHHTKHAVDKLALFVVPVGRLAKAFKVAVVTCNVLGLCKRLVRCILLIWLTMANVTLVYSDMSRGHYMTPLKTRGHVAVYAYRAKYKFA